MSFFDETIGVTPTNRIMGEETFFLMNLQQRGFRMLYHPDALVYHRILQEAMHGAMA